MSWKVSKKNFGIKILFRESRTLGGCIFQMDQRKCDRRSESFPSGGVFLYLLREVLRWYIYIYIFGIHSPEQVALPPVKKNFLKNRIYIRALSLYFYSLCVHLQLYTHFSSEPGNIMMEKVSGNKHKSNALPFSFSIAFSFPFDDCFFNCSKCSNDIIHAFLLNLQLLSWKFTVSFLECGTCGLHLSFTYASYCTAALNVFTLWQIIDWCDTFNICVNFIREQQWHCNYLFGELRT